MHAAPPAPQAPRQYAFTASEDAAWPRLRWPPASPCARVAADPGERLFTMGALIFVLAVVLVALVLVFAGVKTVAQGTNWTLERFGRYTRTLNPGLHVIVPFIDTVGRKMNIQENVLDIPGQKVITKDNATIQV